MMKRSPFGIMPDGRPVECYTIRAGDLSANILTYGAVLRDLRLKRHVAPLVLGFERLDHYLAHSIFHGAIVGRFANRIAHGRFTLDGREYAIAPNDRGHLLHGGAGGIDQKVWQCTEIGTDFVTLSLRDTPEHSGFPGTLSLTCIYRLCPPATLSVELTATTDAATPCSLAHHSWFNLDDGGAADILGHRLTIAADGYLPVDDTGIPTGEVRPVAGSPFDFRDGRRVGETGQRYDHNFCLADARRELTFAARLEGARSGLGMEVWTTEPGLQFFDGGAPTRAMAGLDGVRYGRHAGLCLEPQAWPDSPNNAGFPPAVLRPGEAYRQLTEFRFVPLAETV